MSTLMAAAPCKRGGIEKLASLQKSSRLVAVSRRFAQLRQSGERREIITKPISRQASSESNELLRQARATAHATARHVGAPLRTDWD